jgi:octaprenyl-diphosphate synthase
MTPVVEQREAVKRHLRSLYAPVEKELAQVETILRTELRSPDPFVDTLVQHAFRLGGKRLRPALVLLSAKATGEVTHDHLVLAAVVEMIHTATLLHDDVVDESALRRGHATANAEFGNAASVLVGDFLYSRAFQLMVSVGSMRVLEILSQATNVIAEGEVLQLMNTRNPDLDEVAYLRVIQRKTAKLFEAAAQLGAVLGGADPEREAALARYGMHLGTSFQLVDDVLDYMGERSIFGKNLGADLAEGKMTLPLIRAAAVGTPADAALIRAAISSGNDTDFTPIMDILERTGALDYARRRAVEESDAGAATLAALSPSPYKENLLELVSFAARRTY